MEGLDIVQQLLEITTKALVDYPEAINICIKTGSLNVFEIRADTRDHGKIIGKQGKNIAAIRTLFLASLSKNKLRGVLEFVEE